jgi:ATP-dependent 26S proteasome regulatory subunit
MLVRDTSSWAAQNQRALVAELAHVRAALQRQIAREAAPLPPPEAERPISPPPAIDTLCELFNLSPFERALLLLCAGVELDGSLAALCAEAHGDPGRAYPTFSLALAALPGAHWDAITPTGALRRWRLIEIGPGAALTLSPLRASEQVVHFLAGVQEFDERLLRLLEPVRPSELAPSHQGLAAELVGAWRGARGGPLPVVQLCGQGRGDKWAIAASGCAQLGLRLNALAAARIPTAAADLDTLIGIWSRDAVLLGSALLLDCDDLDPADAERARAVDLLIDQLRGALIVAGRERRAVRRRPTVALEIQRPLPDEQRALWHAALSPLGERLAAPIDQLVAQFSLDSQAIRTIGATISHRIETDADESAIGNLQSAIWAACRGHARNQLDELAQRIAPAAAWDDLVLPEPQLAILRDVAAHVRQRAQVYERWGFAAKGARGLGITVLFAGPSGTGKTTAAELLAGDLQLDLYRIDLSAIVSKYIGETEKNLRRIFDAAEQSGAVLLFDEADALFGKRSEVKDSHDRYANIEVSYLLQRMETYPGLAILTTNLKQSIDQAFMRRIRFVVQFPFPDAAQRAAIWGRVFPRSTPTAGLELDKLARLNIAGGNIRTIALNAAFLAADAGEPVQMRHLLRAARVEYGKLEKPLTEAETAGWI